jgi:hypothetical protein
LLNESSIVDLIRSRCPLRHVLHSGLSCLAGVERSLCLGLIEMVRVRHIQEIELLKLSRSE